jgi:hypothetical protein
MLFHYDIVSYIYLYHLSYMCELNSAAYIRCIRFLSKFGCDRFVEFSFPFLFFFSIEKVRFVSRNTGDHRQTPKHTHGNTRNWCCQNIAAFSDSVLSFYWRLQPKEKKLWSTSLAAKLPRLSPRRATRERVQNAEDSDDASYSRHQRTHGCTRFVSSCMDS